MAGIKFMVDRLKFNATLLPNRLELLNSYKRVFLTKEKYSTNSVWHTFSGRKGVPLHPKTLFWIRHCTEAVLVTTEDFFPRTRPWVNCFCVLAQHCLWPAIIIPLPVKLL